jgi:catechol 2,3-dioxygenase-like lactoylglutathione lyase family enzyme
MSNKHQFNAAYPYQTNVLALPVMDLDVAAAWYSRHFGMTEVERTDQPVPTVILERDGTRIGFAITGGDASQSQASGLLRRRA